MLKFQIKLMSSCLFLVSFCKFLQIITVFYDEMLVYKLHNYKLMLNWSSKRPAPSGFKSSKFMDIVFS